MCEAQNLVQRPASTASRGGSQTFAPLPDLWGSGWDDGLSGAGSRVPTSNEGTIEEYSAIGQLLF